MKVSQQAAARFLLHQQGLLSGNMGQLWRQEQSGETGAFTVLSRLECVQIDPVNVLNRNQNLVLAARVSGYKQDHLERLLEKGQIIDYIANARCFLPMYDWPILKPVTEHLAKRLAGEMVRLGNHFERVYSLVAKEGPLSSRQVIDDEKILGWWDQNQPKTKASSLALEVLWHLGRIGISKRDANERYYNLIEKIVPDAIQQQREALGDDTAKALLLRKYMRAYRLFFPSHFRFGWLPEPAAKKRAHLTILEQQGEVIPVQIEGVRRAYWILAEDAEMLQGASHWEVEHEATLLPPLDNLLWLRERLQDVFVFDYTWEIYAQPHKRKYGTYTLPCLLGDRFCGRLDAHVERTAGTLMLDNFYPEPWVTALSVRERKKALTPVKSAVKRLAQACEVPEVKLTPGAAADTTFLMP